MREGQPLPAAERRLAQATRRAVEAAGGLKNAEAESTVSDSQISRCCSTKHHDSISIRDAVRIDAIGVHEAGYPHILGTMANLLGAVVILLPDAQGTSPCLRLSVIEMTGELGEVARSIAKAFAPGGADGANVTPAEAEAALDRVADLERATARVRHQLEAIVHADRPFEAPS